MQKTSEISFEHALPGYWEWLIDQNQFVLSDELLEQLGYGGYEMSQAFTIWETLVHPDDLALLTQTLGKQAQEKACPPYAITIRFMHLSGYPICFTQTGKVIARDDQGNPTRLLGSHIQLDPQICPEKIRMNREEARLYQARLFEKANEVARIGTWEFDCGNKQPIWSPITREIHQVDSGYMPNLEEAIYFYQEGISRDQIVKSFNNAITLGTPYDLELQMITQKGNKRWVRTVGVPEFEDGVCQRIYGIFQDIDAQKTAEEKVNLSLQRNRILIEQCPNALAMLDNELKYLAYSQKFSEVFGIGNDGSNRFHLLELLSANGLKGKQMIRRCLAGQTIALNELSFQQSDVPDRWLALTLKPWYVMEKSIGGVLIYAEDITQSRQNHMLLAESEEKFRRIFEDAAVAMAIVSLEGKWKKVNRQMSQLLGYTQEELLLMTFQDMTHPEDLQQDQLNLQNLLKGKQENYHTEKRYFHKNGQVVWIFLAVTVIKDPEGKPKHFISQMKNITARKEASRQLEKNLQVIQEQNDRLMNFAHIVSHNLRSHTGNLEAMLLLHALETEESEKKILIQNVSEISSSLSETVNHLTQIVQTQVSLGQPKETVQLKHFLLKALRTLQIDITQSNAQVNINIDETITIDFNSAYLDSIFLNLLSNAIKYKHRERNPVINVSVVESAEFNVLVFEDNGLGIDLDKFGHKLFGLYQTFHGHPKAQGVGLFLTKSQIEAMGGSIEVESKIDNGTTFRIFFPKEISDK